MKLTPAVKHTENQPIQLSTHNRDYIGTIADFGQMGTDVTFIIKTIHGLEHVSAESIISWKIPQVAA